VTDHPVFTREGDAVEEVRGLVARLAREHGSEESAGLHRVLFVSRAGMTVVMVTAGDAPLARELRALGAWTEPRER
jgi:hypothetical protein